MITYLRGNLFNNDADAFVNAVNCKGPMGAGIAYGFKLKFPEMYEAYRTACQKGEVRIGKIHTFDYGDYAKPRWILNFPTMVNPGSTARLDDIRQGLTDLVGVLDNEGIGSVACCSLGCGIGGLHYLDLKALVDEAVVQIPHVDFRLYEPGR